MPGTCAVPDFKTVRVLGGKLPTPAGSHPYDDRHAKLAPRHVPQRGRVIDDLIERQQAEIDRHHFDNRAAFPPTPRRCLHRRTPIPTMARLAHAQGQILRAARGCTRSSPRTGQRPRPSERRVGRRSQRSARCRTHCLAIRHLCRRGHAHRQLSTYFARKQPTSNEPTKAAYTRLSADSPPVPTGWPRRTRWLRSARQTISASI